MSMRPVLLLLLAAMALAEDLAPRVHELERQVAELMAWRRSQEGQRPAAAAATAQREAGAGIIAVAITNRRFQALDYNKGINNDGLYWDTTCRLTGRDKPVRAVKGMLVFNDLFGEQRLRIAWTFSGIVAKDKPLVERGKGIVFDALNPDHVWLRTQKDGDFTAALVVNHIIYQDGTSEMFGGE